MFEMSDFLSLKDNNKKQQYSPVDTTVSPTSSSSDTSFLSEDENIIKRNTHKYKAKLHDYYRSWLNLSIRLRILTGISFVIILVNLFFFIINCISSTSSFGKHWFPFFHKKNKNDKIQLTLQNYKQFVSPISLLNATFLFNSINSFLKQKGADVFPVGVSFVPATIPKNTMVYHYGTGIPDSFEWLAMDVEFSLNFGSRSQLAKRGTALVNSNIQSRATSDNPEDGGDFPSPPDGEEDAPPPLAKKDTLTEEAIDYCAAPPSGNNDRHNGPPGMNGPGKNGEPHTLMSFQLKHDLTKLLLLDGASASKSESTGEMDTQIVLYNQIRKQYPELPQEPAMHMQERDYADMICKWGEKYGLEGYIRVELGFEVILCDFKKHLDLVSNVSMNDVGDFFDLPAPVNISAATGWPINCTDGTLKLDELSSEQKEILELEDLRYNQLSTFESINSWEQVRVAGFSHDTGENRVDIDYRYLVTAINETELSKDNYAWRIIKEDSDDLEVKLFNKVDKIVKNKKNFNAEKSTNWQEKTEQIEFKFTPFIKNIQAALNDDELSIGEKAIKVTHFTYPIVKRYLTGKGTDTTYANVTQEAVWEYTYPTSKLSTESDKLIFSSLTKVMEEVVAMIINVHKISLPIGNDYLKTGNKQTSLDTSEFEKLASQVNELVDNLNWITFGYDCSKKCGLNELCFTPSWGPSPVGWVPLKQGESRGGPGGGHFGNNNGELPIGFESDPATGFTRIKSDQECIGLEYFINKTLHR